VTHTRNIVAALCGGREGKGAGGEEYGLREGALPPTANRLLHHRVRATNGCVAVCVFSMCGNVCARVCEGTPPPSPNRLLHHPICAANLLLEICCWDVSIEL